MRAYDSMRGLSGDTLSTRCLADMQNQEDIIRELKSQLVQRNQEQRQALAAFQAERGEWEVSMEVSLQRCPPTQPDLPQKSLLSINCQLPARPHWFCQG